jgi:hypothetical protein
MADSLNPVHQAHPGPGDVHKFEYAIVFPNGVYYVGPGSSVLPENAHIGVAREGTKLLSKKYSYTSTEKGAYSAIARNPETFKGCTVVKVL